MSLKRASTSCERKAEVKQLEGAGGGGGGAPGHPFQSSVCLAAAGIKKSHQMSDRCNLSTGPES